MTVYLVAQITIHDQDRYGEYGSGFMEIFSKYQGTLLSVDEAPVKLEGNWDYTRTVLISFPSEEAAMAWYRSEEYQALAQHRFAASDANAAIIHGLS